MRVEAFFVLNITVLKSGGEVCRDGSVNGQIPNEYEDPLDVQNPGKSKQVW